SNGTLAASTNRWDKNFALNDAYSWDVHVSMVDKLTSAYRNDTYDEFGVKKYASITSWGNPSRSIPPGATETLESPSYLSYSINSAYTLNVSIPHLFKDANPLLSNITADNVQVNNTHPNANALNSEISVWTAFAGSNVARCIWGKPGSTLPPVGNGTMSAGTNYTDYTHSGAFEYTQVWWRVTVPAATPEGTYRATITITLWS
ncbi:MAG: hypothetical protein R6W91_05085, partial [Thermoplasmata archaeon]